MAITRADWNGVDGYDFHALPGTPSQPLNELLVVGIDGTAMFAHNIPAASGVTVKFFGEFEGAPSRHGVLVGEITGRITVASPRPPIRLHNFLVRAEVKDASGTFTTTPRLRVHVHDALAGAKAWLTPNPLTIRRGADGQRLSILAEFDDGVIGDITYLSGITWSSADDTKVAVDPSTGRLSAKVNTADGVVITATLPAGAWGGLAITAKVNARPPWATQAKATLIPKSAGRQAVAEVPNFLFLADGFGPGEEGKFRKLACQVAESLRTDERTSPFKLLKNAINYWMVWLESPERGCSVLHEVHAFPRAGKTIGAELPLARKPAPPPTPPAQPPRWTLEELINEVGLPIPSDAIPDGSGPILIGAMFILKLGTWTTLYGAKIMNRVDVDLYQQWANLADRRLMDERNTAIGLAVGSRPNHDWPTPSRGIGWHPLRTTRAHLDEFLKLIVDEDGGAAIGTHWGSPAGKDRPFIFVLAAGTRHAGMLTPGELIASSLESNTEISIAATTGRGVRIIPNPIPRRASLDTTTRVAHESAHGLSLGDEYGAVGRISAASVPFVTADLNLQDEPSLLTSPPPPTLPGLDGAKIKWLWPRIAKAGVLTGFPTPAGGGFEIPVTPGHEAPFQDGDIVHVRVRPLRANIIPSDALRIVPNGVSSGKLEVQALGPIVVGPTMFPLGSIVYSPVIDLPPLGTGKTLLLVHDRVQAHITATGQPLNAPANAPLARSCGDEGPDSRQSQVATNLPAGLALPKGVFRAWVVGAYEGGGEHQCGLYHPAGACIMRARLFHELVLVLGRRTPHVIMNELVFTFCPVCRYILVDRLDPTKHGEVDKWYAKRYPG